MKSLFLTFTMACVILLTTNPGLLCTAQPFAARSGEYVAYTVMRRSASSTFHNKTWNEMLKTQPPLQSEGDEWIGLERAHQLTKDGKCILLYVQLGSSSKYDSVVVGDGGTDYAIAASKCNRSWTKVGPCVMDAYSGMKFSTFDRDNSKHAGGNCPLRHGGAAWWYDAECQSPLPDRKSNSSFSLKIFCKVDSLPLN